MNRKVRTKGMYMWNMKALPLIVLKLGIRFMFLWMTDRQKAGQTDGRMRLIVPSLSQKRGTTRGPKGHISCTWVQCATVLTDWPGRPSCFLDRPAKHKLDRGCWDLSSCQVSSNSVRQFQRRSRKCLSQLEARAAILFFRLAQKTQTR